MSPFSDTLSDGISTSMGRMAFDPYASEYGVGLVGVRILVQYAHKVGFN